MTNPHQERADSLAILVRLHYHGLSLRLFNLLGVDEVIRQAAKALFEDCWSDGYNLGRKEDDGTKEE